MRTSDWDIYPVDNLSCAAKRTSSLNFMAFDFAMLTFSDSYLSMIRVRENFVMET